MTQKFTAEDYAGALARARAAGRLGADTDIILEALTLAASDMRERERERERVVKWLRETQGTEADRDLPYAIAADLFANLIEAGEHMEKADG